MHATKANLQNARTDLNIDGLVQAAKTQDIPRHWAPLHTSARSSRRGHSVVDAAFQKHAVFCSGTQKQKAKAHASSPSTMAVPDLQIVQRSIWLVCMRSLFTFQTAQKQLRRYTLFGIGGLPFPRTTIIGPQESSKCTSSMRLMVLGVNWIPSEPLNQNALNGFSKQGSKAL